MYIKLKLLLNMFKQAGSTKSDLTARNWKWKLMGGKKLIEQDEVESEQLLYMFERK